MKIAMIGQKGMPAKYGGVEQHVHDLSLCLVKDGHTVTVYSRKWYSGIAREEIGGVKIKLMPSIHTKHLDTITHVFFATIHALFQNYDIIHYHGVGPSLVSWIPKIFKPKTIIVTTFHSIDRHHQKWNWFAKLVLRFGERTACWFADKTIVISKSLDHYCLNEFNKKAVYIPNGVNIDKKEIGIDEITKFGLIKNQYIVMVSRLVPHKGAHLLVEAFHKLKKLYKHDEKIQNLKLAIVGGSVYTDDYVMELEKQAGAVNDIIFTDFQSGKILEQLYKNSLALAHPSINEGLPITVLKAMSYGRPAIVSSIPEHMEIIRDFRMIFEKNNVNSLVEKLYEFISMSEDEQRRIGEENQIIIEDQYSWDKIIPQISELYKNECKSYKLKVISLKSKVIS